MGPRVVVAGIAAGSIRAHLHLLMECPGQMVTELLAPLCIHLLCFTLLLLPAAAHSRELTQDLLQHPASEGRQQLPGYSINLAKPLFTRQSQCLSICHTYSSQKGTLVLYLPSAALSINEHMMKF